MKYLPLVWAGLWRKRLRTIFTLLSIVVAFLLFGMLQGVNSAFSNATANADLGRLVVSSKFAFTIALPVSYAERIKAVPGVTGVADQQWFGGYYQDQKNQVVSYAVHADSYLKLFPEFQIPKDQVEALLHTRTGAIVGVRLAKKYNWKIGDQIPLSSAIWIKKSDRTSNWTFDLVGIFDDPENNWRANTMLFNYDYFDEARSIGNGTVGWFIVGIDDPKKASKIGADIDALFVNSPNETHTQTEKEFGQAFLKQMGDINFIVGAIIGAVFFTLLFLTGNTMMQSVRERIPELAVLKTLGFSDDGIAALVIAESSVLCLTAAAIGLILASAIFPFLKDVLVISGLPAQVVAEGFAIAAGVAFVTALPPAFRARRLSIVDALAQR